MNNIAGMHAGSIVHFVMETDVNGVIEWKEESASLTDIWVMGYIR